MATPVIYKGDDTDFKGAAALSVNISTDFDLDGCAVSLVFLGCRREYTGLTGRSAMIPLAFSAKETGAMPVGTHRATVRVSDSAGRVRTASDNIRIRVTDDLREAYGGAEEQEIDVTVEAGIDPTRLMEGMTLKTNTPNSMRQAIKKIAQALGATVSALAVSVLPVLGASVQTAPLGDLDLDQNPSVVTNVTFAGLLTEHQDISGKADRTNTYTKAETDAKIVELAPDPDFTTNNTALVETIKETAPAPGDYANVSYAAMNAVQQGSQNWLDAESKMGAITASGDEFFPWSFMGSAYFADELVWPGDGYNYHLVYDESAMRWITWYAPPGSEDMIDEETGRYSTQEDIAYLSDIPAQQDLSGYATMRYADGAASSAVTPVSNKVETTAAIVNTWETYWGGTNVVMEVTDYYGNTTGTLPRLRIREYRDGAWTNVWDEVDKFNVCKKEILGDVAKSNETERAVASTNFAPIAWGSVTDKGSPNPATNTTYMTSPQTYFGGGTEYQRIAVGSGAICVLVDKGALAHTVGEPGTFRFQDDGGTNYFGFVKTDSYTIGCRTDGIVPNGNLITLRYDVIMSGTDVPVVYWKEVLESAEPWTQLNNVDGTAASGAPYTVTWLQEGGSYYANINCGSNASGFFKAETSVAGDVVWETNMKARLGGGLECTNTATHVNGVIRPSYNGSTVIWTWSAR